MRTRFLNTDYFSPSPSSSIETLNFLNLPVPHLHHSRLSTFDEDLSLFDSALNISIEIDRLHIDTALSKFFSEVIPQIVEYGDFEAIWSQNRKGCFGKKRSFGSADVEIRLSEREAEVLYEEKEGEIYRIFGSETLEVEYPKKDNETAVDNKDDHRFQMLQFETPELDVFLENACFVEKEVQFLSEVQEIENNLDMLKPGLGMQYPKEFQESVYSVEDITSGYHMEQKTYILEAGGSFQDQMSPQHSTFPLLEMDEISLGTLTSQSMEEELLSVLGNIEPRHWTRKDSLLINSKELLGSIEYDIFDFLSDNCLLKQYLESEMVFPDMFPEMDFVSIVETSQIKGNSAFRQGTSDGDCLSSMSPVIFQEFQFFDVDSSELFDVFFNRQTADEPETCDWMFREDMNFKNFDELIVSHELALEDDTFKSLPVPILSDHEKIRSLYTIVEGMLTELKPRPLSSSDGIYLDWHLLEEDNCSSKIYSSYQRMLADIDSFSFQFDHESFDNGKLVFDFVFSDVALNGPNTEGYEESLDIHSDGISMLNFHVMGVDSCKSFNNGCPKPGNREQLADFSDDALNGPNTEGYEESVDIHSDGISMLNVHVMGVDSSKLFNDGCPKSGNGEQLVENNSERASLLFKSMSQINDLDFFSNPQKATSGGNSESVVKAFDTNATFPKVPSSDSMAACAHSGVQLQLWDITVYKVKLSDNIVDLIGNFEKNYLAILQNETELNSLLELDSFKLLSLSKQKMMDCIKKKIGRRTTSCGDENVMAFVTLCAIKQMAWYMCFYGIHTTHLYVDKLCRSLDWLKSRLGCLHLLIEDAHWKVDKEITRSHPSLSVIQGILRLNTTDGSLKVLIVAEQVFWWSLKNLLASMGLSCNELQNFYTRANQPDVCDTSEITNAKMDALLASDCLLVSHKHVSASFPFNKFSILLEYGGSYGSSSISSLSPKLIGLPHLHFIRVELDDSSASKALCEGVDMTQNIEMKMEGESHSILALDGNLNDQKLEELLNFVPVENKHNMRSLEDADKVEACHVALPVPLPSAIESEQIQRSMVPFPDVVIIVNTQNLDEVMIVSRRSTYQRILAMEKEGAQVVERDSDLPVDLIISSAICLVWYDCRNIGKKTTTLNEASSCLPVCLENIATNVLTMLSFSFSGCILVFEGEISFLSTVMESSDGLYAAAASLGIDLQLFFSYSSDLTDEIILSCIGYAAKLTRGLYPKMPESETLAESFLTKFPSINPLTAHAILSSVRLLIEFLQWSHDRRIHAIQNYYVPDESVTLFSALCRYGEREDSKSIMTDCSSSASSGPDSDNCHFNVNSETKRQKYITSPHKIDIQLDDSLHFGSLHQFTDGIRNPSRVSKPYNSWKSKDPELFGEYKKGSSSLNDQFGEIQESDFATMMNPYRAFKPYDSQISKDLQLLNEIKKPNLPFRDKLLGQNQGSEMAITNNLDWYNSNNTKTRHEDCIGEVIDLTDSPLSGKEFSSIANSMYFSPFMPEKEEDSARKSKTARRLSFDKSSRPTFPMAAEINSGSGILSSIKDPRQSLQGTNDHPDTDYNNDKLLLKQQKNFSDEVLRQRSAGSKELSFKEELSHYGGTPLLNAIHSAHPQPGSPWTMEFLNRIREKSRLRQQSLPCDTSAPCFGISCNVSKVTKRKSPSILEFFKYQGGRTPRNVPEQKKQSVQSSGSSKRERTSASLCPIWTPTDKRARQNLSFAMNESGSQTRLVWSDGVAHRLSKKFRNQ